MPSLRNNLRSRREQWNTRHFVFLRSGIDWPFLGGDGWGNLSALSDEQLRDTVRDMQACWRVHGGEIAELCEGMHRDGPPWFAEYANDLERLVAEATADRNYMQEQHRRGGYFPREQMNDYTTSAPPAPATAATN